jgi:hypothetical protein
MEAVDVRRSKDVDKDPKVLRDTDEKLLVRTPFQTVRPADTLTEVATCNELRMSNDPRKRTVPSVDTFDRATRSPLTERVDAETVSERLLMVWCTVRVFRVVNKFVMVRLDNVLM